MSEQEINNLKEEIYKCSKCGQCRCVCPVFLSFKNEIYSPRGRFIAMNNKLSNSEKPDVEFIKNLDKCLYCNLCKKFCPSNIDSSRIFSDLKKEFGFRYSFIPFSLFFKIYLFFCGIKSFIFNKKKCSSLKNFPENPNILYFQGCYNKYVDSGDRNSVVKILSESGFNVKKISSLCCGYSYLTDSETEKYMKNIKKIEKEISDDIKYIVCSCDSCYENLKNSGSKIISDKLKRFEELVPELCVNDFSDALLFKTLIRSDDFRFNIKTVDKSGLCSGGENFIYLKYPAFSRRLVSNSVKILSEYPQKIIITTCNCTKNALKKYVKNKKIMSLAEFINGKQQH